MKLSRTFQHLPWIAGVFAACAIASAGCAAPSAEPQGKTTAKLLAPRPIFKAKASPVSANAYGITEWRLYRGKRDVVMTGYDKNGKPVKGLSIGFHADGKSSAATLRARVLDGSWFAARHTYGARSSTNKSVSPATKRFLQIALADLQVVRASIAAKGTKSNRTLGCGGDLSGVILQAIQCVMSSGGLNPQALQQCIQAAASAAGSGATCTDPNSGQPPYDPTGQSTSTGTGTGGFPNNPYDPSGGQNTGTDPGTDPSTDPGTEPYPGDTSGQYPGDVGTGYPGDPCPQDDGSGTGIPTDGQYPQDDGSGTGVPTDGQYPQDDGSGTGIPTDGQYPGDMSDPYGDQGACPSCTGGMDDGTGDILSDGNNGGVDYGDPYGGDYGAGDYGGDYGGGYGEGY